MEWAPWFAGPRCRSCSEIAPREALTCPECGDALLAFAVEQIDSDGLESAARALPVRLPEQGIVPGGTPLVRSRWLEEESGAERVLIKDEGRNPTGHVSDRGMMIAAGAARLLSTAAIALPSPGRTGVAASAAAAASGLSAYVHVPSRAPFPAKAMINVHGGDMMVIGGRFRDAEGAFREADDDQWSVEPFRNPYTRAGRAKIYLEVLAALDGEVPDTLVIPTGTGASIVAIADAAHACREAGITGQVPHIVAAQPRGCAPIVDAFVTEQRGIVSIDSPDTICGELEIPSPAGGDAALASIRELGGEAIAVPDPAALEAAVHLANHTGISASVAGGVAAAATTSLSDTQNGDTVVVLNPGAGGLDADILRSHLMGQGI